jgi:hypothetical protein
MVVEPFANDDASSNLNPVGRIYYSASTLFCVAASLSQEVGLDLGAQAGEARLREVVITAGGFTRFRRAAETPFNLVFEARPWSLWRPLECFRGRKKVSPAPHHLRNFSTNR